MEKNIWINHFTDYEEAEVNLFCFHHAGGSSTFFAPWIRLMPHSINIIPVQYPMRDNRRNEPMPETLQKLAENMVDETPDLYDKPFVFLGHCSGSLIAFEAARYVKEKYGKEPLMLFVSAQIAPEHCKLKSTKNLPDDVFFKFYHFPEEMLDRSNPLFEFFLPTLRMDFNICERYRYKGGDRVNCPIFAFGGDDDYAVKDLNQLYDWKNYTSSSDFESRIYPGDHLFFERNREEICKIISDKLLNMVK